jgi:hypothetical protein
MRTCMMLGSAALLVMGAAAFGQDYLLIPESTNDTVGMYDAFDGTYLGDFAAVPQIFGTSSTPINAVYGPDGFVYVSDQVQDAVFKFALDGTYIDVFAGPDDGLNNIRGIDFSGGKMFVTSGDDYVAAFDLATGDRLPDFINDGSDPFDIFFLPDGRSLVADIAGTTDNVRLYGSDGVLIEELFSINFPEQIQSASGGQFLNASFSGDAITRFNLDGTIDSQVFFNAGRGVFELGNGNYLATAGDGIFEISPIDGSIIEEERLGVSGRFIELIPAPSTAVLFGLGLTALRRRR